MKTRHDILNAESPEQIFHSNDIVVLKKEYKELARRFHPDSVSGCVETFQKLNQLYNRAYDRMVDGTWRNSGHRLLLKDSKSLIIKSMLFSKKFEIGESFVARDYIVHVVEKKYSDLFLKVLKLKFKYANLKMQNEVSHYLPEIKELFANVHRFELENGNIGLVYKKSPNYFPLSDILKYYKGKIPGRHAAWIIGTLNNLVCYFNYAKLSHQGINLDNYYINPESHRGALLGGYWYLTKVGFDVKMMPKFTHDNLPFDVKRDKKASLLTDCETVKAIGRQIIGDNDRIPDPIKKWLDSVSSKDAFHEYKKWDEALKKVGPRKFVKMEIRESDLYGVIY